MAGANHPKVAPSLSLAAREGGELVCPTGVEPAPTDHINSRQDTPSRDACTPSTCEGTDPKTVDLRLEIPSRVNETVQRESNRDLDLARLLALWPGLSPSDRTAILALVTSLVAKES